MARGTPLVSVIMSVFNGAAYLAESLHSIQQQTFHDFEFIVIDDGSTDGSWDILKSAASDPRLVLLRNTVNYGFAISQNLGIARSRGSLIALQDQDDVSLPGRLERQVEYLRSNPEVGLVGVWPQFVDSSGAPIENRAFRLAEGNRELQIRLLRESCICGPSVMLQRRWLEAAGPYDPSLRAAEDYDLLLRVSEVTQLANLPDRLYIYRHHADSVSSRQGFLQRQNRAVALDRAFGRRYGSDLPVSMAAFAADYYLRAAFFGLVEEKTEEARRCVNRALELAPWASRAGVLIEESLGRYFLRQQFRNPLSLVDRMFGDLLPATWHLRQVRSRLISRIHMRAVFEGGGPASQPGKPLLPGSSVSHLWAGVRFDPRWLFNRGVWSIALHQFVRRPTRLSS